MGPVGPMMTPSVKVLRPAKVCAFSSIYPLVVALAGAILMVLLIFCNGATVLIGIIFEAVVLLS
jgi:hypothetical protein